MRVNKRQIQTPPTACAAPPGEFGSLQCLPEATLSTAHLISPDRNEVTVKLSNVKVMTTKM